MENQHFLTAKMGHGPLALNGAPFGDSTLGTNQKNTCSKPQKDRVN